MYHEDTPHESVSESLHNYRAKSDVLIIGRQGACDIINQPQLAVTTKPPSTIILVPQPGKSYLQSVMLDYPLENTSQTSIQTYVKLVN
jgi:hypothetical protein